MPRLFFYRIHSMSAIQLIIGLGNPGPRYHATRHNAGFWWLDEIAARHGVSFRKEARFHGEVAEINNNGHHYRLLKPQTFMNLSGQAVQSLCHFYKIASNAILVAHDELDLPCGVAKLKLGGGHAGHNGLKDICQRLGTNNYWRLRIGIEHPRNHHGQAVADYVLETPSRDQQIGIQLALENSYRVLPKILAGAFDKAQQELHAADLSMK
jgi:peptidyl-tRNA hydrolase, PTH1 family